MEITTVFQIIQIIGFALAIASFIGLLIGWEKKIVVIVAALVAFVIIGGVKVYEYHYHWMRVESTSGLIVKELGTDRKTLDQLCQTFRPQEVQFVEEALTELVNIRKVGHKILDMRDDLSSRYPVRIYYVQ